MKPSTIFLIIIIAIILLRIIETIIRINNKNKKEEKTIKNYSYKKIHYLLTKNEYQLYKELKQICLKSNLIICPKVRLADIIEPDEKGKTYMPAFNRIKSKHIDFLLCKEPLSPILAIELDDSSHNKLNRINRDIFVDEALKQANIPLLRIYGIQELENKIKGLITIEITEQK